MKRLYFAALLMLIATSALAFNFDFGFNFGGGSTVRYVDLLPSLAWSPSAKAFGNVSTNVEHSQLFTLTNSGNDLAEDVAITATGTSFRMYSSTCGANPFTLAAGANCAAKVGFKPLTAATFNGFANYTAPNIAKVSAALSGTGVATASYNDILLFWRAETTTQTTGDYPTSGAWSPNNGNATISATAALIGSNGVLSNAAYGYYYRGITLPNAALGRIAFLVRQPTTWQARTFVRYYVDASNYLYAIGATSGNITFGHKIANTATTATSSFNGMTADATYCVEMAWNNATGLQKIYINGVERASATPSVTALSNTGQMQVGESAGTATPNEYVDNIMVSSDPARDFYGGGTGLCYASSSPR